MNLWTLRAAHLDLWTSPVRPSSEDVGMFKNQLEAADKTLLLGVTQELEPLATLAVDHNPAVIEIHRAHAILADWAELPFESEFDAVIGDGSLTVFQGTPHRFFQQVKKVLKPNGRLILRQYVSPEEKEDLAAVAAEKGKMGFHAFKWRVAHVLADPYVKVEDLYRAMRPIWDHPTLEIYRGSDLSYYFPKLSEIPPWDHIQFGGYELAELCPVVTWRRDSLRTD